MKTPLLSQEELNTAVAELDGWRVEDGMLRRTVECPSFPEAIGFVDRVAETAEAMNHHPDIDIRWRTVHLAVVTHDSGGLTAKDVELARRVNALTP